MDSLPYALTSCTISSQLFAVINFMLSPTIALPMSIIIVVLLLTYLVTLADSAVLIINTIAAGGDARQRPKMHITVWGAALTPVIGALPFSIVMALMGIVLFKAVIRDGIRARHSSNSGDLIMQSHEIFELGDFPLSSGETLRDARLAYQTYGALSDVGDNVVVMPTFYTGTHARNEGFFGPGRALDPARHFIVSINLFGNGLSSSPSNTDGAQGGGNFPLITFYDNIAAQHRLLTERLGVREIALVLGWSMAGCQSYQWAVQYPDMVKAILPFCASARTSPHNFVFLEGVKAALCADPVWNEGHYETQPVEGLKAFGRVYAGWAFSQAFYRNARYREIGYDSIAALLDDWAEDHAANWDANNLLSKLATWQAGDVSAGPAFQGDLIAALGSIRARAILMPCAQDLYFPPEDNAFEAQYIPNASFRPVLSEFGHCAANPGNDHGFTAQLDANIQELLEH